MSRTGVWWTTSMKVFGHGTTSGLGNAINTRASFVELSSLGVDGVELDVRRTSDDQLVLIHDDRYPDGRLVVETPAIDRPAGVSLLAEALDLCVGLEVNIELKNLPSEETYDPQQRIAELCVSLLEQREATDQVIISCFGLDCIDRVVELSPATPTALLLLSRRPPDVILLAEVHERHRAVHPYVSMVDEAFMRRARDLGLRVNAWSAQQESADDVRALIELGVDGLITESYQQAIQVCGGGRRHDD